MSLDRHAGLAVLAALLDDSLPLAPELLAALREAISLYFRHSGSLTLDRALRLPSPAQHRRAQRDRHLADALRQIAGPSARARAAELRKLLVACAGTYRRWRGLGALPGNSSALQAACYFALGCGKDPAVAFVPSDRLLWQLARNTPADFANAARDHSGVE